MNTLVLIFCLLSTPVLASRYFSVTVPTALSGNDANSAIECFGFDQTRYQQVFEASRLQADGMSNGWIIELRFRVDNDGHSFYGVFSNIQVTLSVATRSESSLSPVFSENTGSNAVIVFAPREVEVFGFQQGGLPAQYFITSLLFETPYYYDVKQGNLLLEIRERSYSGGAFLDAIDVPGDGIASVFAGGGLNGLLPQGRVSSAGLVTQFIFDTVPEPSVLLLLPMLGLGWLIFRRQQRS